MTMSMDLLWRWTKLLHKYPAHTTRSPKISRAPHEQTRRKILKRKAVIIGPPKLKTMPFGPFIRSDIVSVITVMCRTVPEATAFYVGVLEFKIKCDEEVNGHRLVVATSPNLVEFPPQASLRFKVAVTKRDRRAIGNQAGDGVFLQVESDDWETLYDRLKTMRVRLLDSEPREGEHFRAVIAVDPMGNKINIVERRTMTIGKLFMKDCGNGF